MPQGHSQTGQEGHPDPQNGTKAEENHLKCFAGLLSSLADKVRSTLTRACKSPRAALASMFLQAQQAHQMKSNQLSSMQAALKARNCSEEVLSQRIFSQCSIL